ncbi:MAG: hypothetical protein KDD62_01785 [Bdellovibrionales bacterium]|nr:hypothetical protein [Bdellovibrionales bacterium]
MPELAQVGDFCPNTACALYGKVQAGQAKYHQIWPQPPRTPTVSLQDVWPSVLRENRDALPYLEVVKQRNEYPAEFVDDKGNLIDIDLRVVFGDEDDVLDLLGQSTA